MAMQRACHVEMMRPRPYADGAIAGCGAEEPRRPICELVRKFAWLGELVANYWLEPRATRFRAWRPRHALMAVPL